MSTPARPAVFLDKDGTLIENVPYNVDPAKLRLTAHAPQALRMLDGAGYALVVVTNQPGIALGHFDRHAWARLRQALIQRVQLEAGVLLDDVLACPHAPASRQQPSCLCRKPSPGLLRQAAARHQIDLGESWMVGDILDDVEAGRRAGCRCLLMDVGNETEWRRSPLREPEHQVRDLLEAARWILAKSAVPRRQTLRMPTPAEMVDVVASAPGPQGNRS